MDPASSTWGQIREGEGGRGSPHRVVKFVRRLSVLEIELRQAGYELFSVLYSFLLSTIMVRRNLVIG